LLVGRRPADDYKFLSADAFGFEPGAGSGAAIFGVCAFGDYALKTCFAKVTKKLFAATDNVVRVTDMWRSLADQCGQLLLAVD
jgi:hypothetical protein